MSDCSQQSSTNSEEILSENDETIDAKKELESFLSENIEFKIEEIRNELANNRTVLSNLNVKVASCLTTNRFDKLVDEFQSKAKAMEEELDKMELPLPQDEVDAKEEPENTQNCMGIISDDEASANLVIVSQNSNTDSTITLDSD